MNGFHAYSTPPATRATGRSEGTSLAAPRVARAMMPTRTSFSTTAPVTARDSRATISAEGTDRGGAPDTPSRAHDRRGLGTKAMSYDRTKPGARSGAAAATARTRPDSSPTCRAANRGCLNAGLRWNRGNHTARWVPEAPSRPAGYHSGLMPWSAPERGPSAGAIRGAWRILRFAFRVRHDPAPLCREVAGGVVRYLRSRGVEPRGLLVLDAGTGGGALAEAATAAGARVVGLDVADHRGTPIGRTAFVLGS